MGGGFNPKQMSALMRQMGIKTVEVPASKVVVFKEDGTQLTIEPASVSIIEMQGQKQLQVAGEFHEGGSAATGGKESPDSPDSPDDVKIVMEQSHATREAAEAALKRSNGDIAEAIMLLENEKH